MLYIHCEAASKMALPYLRQGLPVVIAILTALSWLCQAVVCKWQGCSWQQPRNTAIALPLWGGRGLKILGLGQNSPTASSQILSVLILPSSSTVHCPKPTAGRGQYSQAPAPTYSRDTIQGHMQQSILKKKS